MRLYAPGKRQLMLVEPGNIRDHHTTSATVNTQTGTITNIQNGYEMVLSKHSIRVAARKN